MGTLHHENGDTLDPEKGTHMIRKKLTHFISKKVHISPGNCAPLIRVKGTLDQDK